MLTHLKLRIKTNVLPEAWKRFLCVLRVTLQHFGGIQLATGARK